jgi:hypothetical protein
LAASFQWGSLEEERAVTGKSFDGTFKLDPMALVPCVALRANTDVLKSGMSFFLEDPHHKLIMLPLLATRPPLTNPEIFVSN